MAQESLLPTNLNSPNNHLPFNLNPSKLGDRQSNLIHLMEEQWQESNEKVIVKLEDMKNHGYLVSKVGQNKVRGLVEHHKRILFCIVSTQMGMVQILN